MYITGSQGTGKSTLLETTLYQDFAKGYSAIVIDPHGQLIDNLIARMPEHRLKDTYLLDMTDEDYPFGLNMFACEDIKSPIVRGMVVDRVEHIFAKIFADSPKGLLLPKVLRNIALTFLEHQGMTLTDVHALLHDTSFRRSLTRTLNNPDVKAYWDEYEQMGRSERKAEIAAISNRLPIFLTAPFVKNIVGQSTSKLNIRDAILNHEILLIKLPVKLLPYTAPIIGTMLIAYIHQATFSFQFLPEEKRPGFSLVVDEFQNFATSDFAELFKEGRKYGARTLVANQDRHDLTEVNRRATLQTYTVVSFRTTPEDAADIAPKFLEAKAYVREEDIYRSVVKHLKEHEHPAVQAFYKAYVLSLLSGAKDGIREYGREYVQETIDILDELFYQTERNKPTETLLGSFVAKMVCLFRWQNYIDYHYYQYRPGESAHIADVQQEVAAKVAQVEAEIKLYDIHLATDEALLRYTSYPGLTTVNWEDMTVEECSQVLQKQASQNAHFAWIMGTYEGQISELRDAVLHRLKEKERSRDSLRKKITLSLGEELRLWYWKHVKYGKNAYYSIEDDREELMRVEKDIATFQQALSSEDALLAYAATWDMYKDKGDIRTYLAERLIRNAEQVAYLQRTDTPEKLLATQRQELEQKIATLQAQIASHHAHLARVIADREARRERILQLEKEEYEQFLALLLEVCEILKTDPLGEKKQTTEREVKERILTLPDYHALVRIGTDTQTIKIKRPPKPVSERERTDRLHRIIDQTHKKYCRERSEVEREIAARRKRGSSELAPTEELVQPYSRFEEI